MTTRLFVATLVLLGALPGHGRPATAQLDESLLDPAYPEMRLWAAAGANLPVPGLASRTEIRLRPGEDLAAAVAVPNRIVRLEAGVYRVTDAVVFADNVILRGASPFQTKLILKMRGERPTATKGKPLPWTTGLLLENISGSGVENLSVQFEERSINALNLVRSPNDDSNQQQQVEGSFPPPPDPRLRARGYVDDPDGQKDLHVVAVRFSGSRQCWLANVVIRNSGQHPILLESSNHLTLQNVEVSGTYNKGADSGSLRISGCEYCLLSGLTVADINHVSLGNDSFGHPSRFNVIQDSRLAVDLRIRDPETSGNLIQGCEIAVPAWHSFPPISLDWDGAKPISAQPNVLYFCTITRDFITERSRFSIADNPNQVYQIRANSATRGNVEVLGPAPKYSTLRPVR
ncbi:MAG: hypothetical protein IT582_07920 [Opitutaceae bacterium]|nr:hypothetical protein [Opitutaceae bacterium]